MTAYKNDRKLTADRLRFLMTYDPLSGQFTWVERHTGGSKEARRGIVAGYKERSGCIRITVDRVQYLAHRLAWLWMTGEWPEGDIDHIDVDRANNRFTNLRVATKSQNKMNQHVRSDSRSGVKGVRLMKGGYNPRICINGKRVSLGLYKTLEEASAAYMRAAVSAHGEFARAK